jgi:hypothetical protein
MSKGLGHVGRAIAAAFDAEPNNAFTTEELCKRVWPEKATGSYWLTRAMSVAVLRAAKSLAVHRPELGVKALKADMARGAPVVFYRQYRVLSYAMARLKGDIFDFKRWQSEAELRAEIAEGGRDYQHVIPGGSWVRHTEMAIAKRDGDTAALERLEAEQERAMEGSALRIAAALPPPKG